MSLASSTDTRQSGGVNGSFHVHIEQLQVGVCTSSSQPSRPYRSRHKTCSECCDFFFSAVRYATHGQKNLSNYMPEQPISAFSVA